MKMSLTTSKNKCLICKREMEQPYGYKDSKLLVVLHKPFRELYGSLSAAIETTLLTELTRAGFGSSEIGITSLLGTTLQMHHLSLVYPCPIPNILGRRYYCLVHH